MWAGVLGVPARSQRVVGRYLGLMLVAGIIAGYGVIIDNPILIVGAMAVSPDLVPLIAASVGIVGALEPGPTGHSDAGRRTRTRHVGGIRRRGVPRRTWDPAKH